MPRERIPFTVETVVIAYEQGIFPMADHRGRIDWFKPRMRALFPITGISVSRSLARTIRREIFDVRFDHAFESVMRSCIRPDDNWITEEFVQLYTEIHELGWAHSAECWREDQLVGGVYGIALGGCFFAESMFHRETDASKVALWALVGECQRLGFTVFDAQIMNPHLASLGAYEVTDEDFQKMLGDALTVETVWGL